MDQSMCIRVFVLCAIMSAPLGTSGLTYDCTSNDDVQISGFPANSYFYAMQNSTQCNVTASGTSISISGCSKDSEILLTYGSYSDMEANSLHGGKSVNAVKVTCNEIPVAGNTHNVSEIFSANLTTDETQSVDASYSVTSALSSYSVNVGDQITWTITFPVEYTLEVTECTASPGTSYVMAEKVDLISSGGCHVSSELISNFTDNGDGTASATIEAFKFYNNAQVFLTCDLKVCPSGSSSCDTSCAGSRKREVGDIFKRSAPDSVTVGFYPRKVHNVLTVFDPSENSAITAYDCTSNDDVQISGFPANSYFYAMQNSTQCNVTASGTSISISGCSKDSEILLTYGSYSDMEANSLHGGKSVNAVKVTCNEIPVAGNTHNVSEIFSANLTIDETQSVDASYNVTSALSSYSVNVGDQITWTITFPVEYSLEVTECTASPGTSYVMAEKVDLISSGGCHVSSELTSNFTDNGDGTASATIKAFKFYNNAQVFLTCDLKVCRSVSSSCDTSCAGSRKREVGDIFKRSAPESVTVGFYPRKVHNVLTVFDPSENSAITVTPFGWSFVFTLTFELCHRLSSVF